MPDAITLRNITIPEDRRSSAIWIAIILSAVIHLGSMFGASAFKPAAVKPGEDLIQVDVYDITRRPEVTRVIPKQELGGGGPGPADAGTMSYTPSGTPDGPTIDLKAALDRGPSQAKIDLNRYEIDRSGGGLDMVYLGGKGSSQSTDEILSQPAIALTRAPGRGGGDGRGVPGVPQPAAQLTIEHRELAKPAARPSSSREPGPAQGRSARLARHELLGCRSDFPTRDNQEARTAVPEVGDRAPDLRHGCCPHLGTA